MAAGLEFIDATIPGMLQYQACYGGALSVHKAGSDRNCHRGVMQDAV